MSGPAHTQPLPEQWNGIEQALDNQLFHEVRMVIDGYRITAMKVVTGKTRLGILVHVDGKILGEWVLPDENGEPKEVARRFWRERRRALYPPKKRARLEKSFGKRQVREYFPNIDKVHRCWVPEWTSAHALRRHLVKNNDEIRVLGPMEDWPE